MGHSTKHSRARMPRAAAATVASLAALLLTCCAGARSLSDAAIANCPSTTNGNTVIDNGDGTSTLSHDCPDGGTMV